MLGQNSKLVLTKNFHRELIILPNEKATEDGGIRQSFQKPTTCSILRQGSFISILKLRPAGVLGCIEHESKVASQEDIWSTLDVCYILREP
jgi:hypothetical protein